MDPIEFGAYIRSHRKQKKISIRQLEAASGVSNAYLSQIENGKKGIPSPDILKKINNPLGISYEILMEKAGYIGLARDQSEKEEKKCIKFIEIDQILEKYENITFKGKTLDDHQKKSMLSFIKTLIEMSE